MFPNRANGGLLRYEDLAGFRVTPEPTVSVKWRGYEIHKPGFWSQGPAMLETLELLDSPGEWYYDRPTKTLYYQPREGEDIVFMGTGGRLSVFRWGYRFLPAKENESAGEQTAGPTPRTLRRLRIVKYRGTLHGTDEYPFLMGEAGISVLPLTSVGLNHDATEERISSGIADLDKMLAGQGFFRGSSILVSGTAGTGKSTLAKILAGAETAVLRIADGLITSRETPAPFDAGTPQH